MLNELLLVLTEFGGGPAGSPANTVVRFLLPSAAWAAIAVVAWRQWREESERRDLFLAIASAIGLSRELFMFFSEYGSFRGYVDYEYMFRYYPPFEHAATMASVIIVACAFMAYFTGARRQAARYLAVGLSATALVYLVTATTWIGYLTDVLAATGRPPLFGSFWGDMLFRVTAVLVFSWHMAVFIVARRRGQVLPWALLAAFGMFWLDEALMVVNLLQKEVHLAFFAPVRHNLHIWAVVLIGSVYWHDIRRRMVDAERRLSESELRFTVAFRSSPTGLVICALDDGRIVEANDAAAGMLGRAAGEIAGKTLREIGPRGAALDGAFRLPCLSADGVRDERIRSDGSRGAEAIIGSANRVTVQGTPCVLVSFRDISEMTRIQEELERSSIELEQANVELEMANSELEEQYAELRKVDRIKDSLLHNVSHELKTPVAKQAMAIELLQLALEHPEPGELRRIAASMEANIHRQEQVIANILDLSRLEKGARQYASEPVRLDGLLEAVLAEYRDELAALGAVVVTRAARIEIVSDREMLWHVFSNIVGNALKFRHRGRAPELGVTVAADGGKAVVSISDNGIGMNPEVARRALEGFYQATPTSEGAGVGLTIAARIVTDLGGSITVTSEGPDRGAVVTVVLPISPETGDATAATLHP